MFENIVKVFSGADLLSVLFMVVITIAAISVGIYAPGYLSRYKDQKSGIHLWMHYICLAVMYVSMMMVVTMRDGFAFLFSWELMTISSFFLILFDGDRREVRRAALNYLILMHIGFVFLLIGFVTLYAKGLPMNFDSLGIYFAQYNVIPLFLLFFIGFGMKAGMFPLHVWLPEAHPAAPSHVSAFMSGVMVKMGVYGIVRVVSYIPQTEQLYAVGLIIFIIGVVTGLWGVILAAVQNNMKKLLAYSTIENIGIILIGLGIGVIGKSYGNSMVAVCGFGGALLHTVNHSFFKSLLFMGAGNVVTALHTTNMDQLGGLGKRMPVTSAVVFVAVLAICALPPLNGFVSEFLIYLGMFDALSGSVAMTIISLFGIIAVSLIGGLVVMAFTKFYGIVFLGAPRSVAASHAKEVKPSMIVAMALPLAGMLLIGFVPVMFAKELFAVVAETFGINNIGVVYSIFSADFVKLTIAVATLAGFILIIYFWRKAVMRGRVVESSPTWGCGFTAPTSKMQYSGESYSNELQRLSRRMTSNSGGTVHFDSEEIFPVEHNFEVKHEDRMDSLFTIWWVEFTHRVNSRLSRIFGTGKVNHYILYAMLFMVLIFILSLLNVI